MLTAQIANFEELELGPALTDHVGDFDDHVTTYTTHITNYDAHVADFVVHSGVFDANTLVINGEVTTSGIDLTGGNLTDVNQVLASGNMTTQGTTIRMPNVPLSDPGIDGALWSDGGTIKISSG